jgi:hypothetical protein
MTFTQSEATAARRRFPVYLVDATDGLTPETGEAAGQPQISKNGGSWTNTSATLTAVGNGAYYVELTTGELDTLGSIAVRYKSSATAEFSRSAVVDVARITPAQVNAEADAALSDAGYTSARAAFLDRLTANTVRLAGTTVSHSIVAYDNQLASGHGALVNVGDRLFIGGRWRRITNKATDEVELDDDTGLGGASGGDAYILPWVPAIIDANAVQVLDTPIPEDPGLLPVQVDAMANNVITTAAIADGAFTAAKFATGFLTADKIASDAITAAKIANDAITASKLANNAITSAKIATDAIGAAQIAANAIGAAEIADNAITAAKIGGNAITSEKLAPNAIGAVQIADNAIGASEIADNAITAAKLATDAGNKIADALLDRANGIETSYSLRHAMRVMLAVAAGKSSNSGGTYRDINDTKPRVTATLTDGNRTAVTVDAA